MEKGYEWRNIEKNHTWELVALPKKKKAVVLKRIYKTKYNEDGNVQKYKAGFVAKGYTSQLGVDFTKTFAPIPRMETIKIVLALATQIQLQVCQLIIK